MKARNFSVFNKQEWGHGPWMNEFDKYEFQSNGFHCLIVRSYVTGALCGYVGLPAEHPFYKKSYEEIDKMTHLECHGGITYSNKCDGEAICHVNIPDDDVWWLGFDCCHMGDYSPFMIAKEMKFFPWLGVIHFPDPGAYKDFIYVRQEVEHLSKQLKEIK